MGEEREFSQAQQGEPRGDKIRIPIRDEELA